MLPVIFILITLELRWVLLHRERVPNLRKLRFRAYRVIVQRFHWRWRISLNRFHRPLKRKPEFHCQGISIILAETKRHLNQLGMPFLLRKVFHLIYLVSLLIAAHFENPRKPNPCAFGSSFGMRVQWTRLHPRSKCTPLSLRAWLVISDVMFRETYKESYGKKSIMLLCWNWKLLSLIS